MTFNFIPFLKILNAVFLASITAEGGSAEAQYNLGIAYEQGAGTKIDPKKAKLWFEKSASLGFEMAQSKLQNKSQ